ncbi:MAG: type II secretion system protein [Phycisphaerae bacterium]
MRTTRSGFTLLEVIVVIGVVALLVSILIPSLSRARGQAKRLACQANLRQLGTAMTVYADSSMSWYPSWSAWHVWGYYETPLDGTDGDDAGPAWTERLKNAGLESVDIFKCPSRYFPDDVPVTYFEAAYAAWHRFERTATRQHDIRYPGEFVLSGDCTNPFFYAPPFGTNVKRDIDDADMDNATSPTLDWSRPAHLKTDNNVLFGDGHAAAYHEFRPKEMTHDTATRHVNWGELDDDG